ncbi:Uncharacterised protein [Vibrio cholerae]|uniref:Uncharacterized protein n=1 Tax=Vibrio cholerae TaxID=666 RepID=A0A655RHG0_VIBCL|nr:Uncharacterised protein [Vibrio cholerae]CSA97636.1 Uncharacterised protein [Vibrio cholerae]CSB01055.1 Uncharacterised protein [Vibrio cholerae]CSB19865.1 Uncharacterised protein [Vibrio cholerae]
MRARSELILLLTANTMQLAEHLCGQSHHSRCFGHVLRQARMEINAVSHWHVAHVLNASH